MFRNRAVALVLLFSFTTFSFAPLAQAAAYKLSNGESLEINPVELPRAPGKLSILEWGWDVPAGSLGGGNIWVSRQFVERGAYAMDPNRPDSLCYDNNLSSINWAKYPTIDLFSVPDTPLVNRFTNVPYYGITSGVGYVIPYADLMAADPGLGTCSPFPGRAPMEWTWDSVPAGSLGNGNAWVSQEFVQKGFSTPSNEYAFDPTLLGADWSKYPLVDFGYNPFPQYGGITSGVGYKIPHADLTAINPNFGILRTYNPNKNGFQRSAPLGGIQGIAKVDGRSVYLIDGSGEHLAYADGSGVHEKTTTITVSGGGGGLFGGGFFSTLMTVAAIGLAIVGIPAVAVTLSEAATSFVAVAKTTMSVVGIASSVITGNVGIGTVLSAAGFTGVPGVPSEIIQVANYANTAVNVVKNGLDPVTAVNFVTGAIGSVTGNPTLEDVIDYGDYEDYDDIPLLEEVADTAEQFADEAGTLSEEVAVMSAEQGQPTTHETAQTTFDVERTGAEAIEVDAPAGIAGITQRRFLNAQGKIVNSEFIDQQTGEVFLTARRNEAGGRDFEIYTPNGGIVQVTPDTGSWTDALKYLDSPERIDVFARLYLCDGRPSCSYLAIKEALGTAYISYKYNLDTNDVSLLLLDGSTKIIPWSEYYNNFTKNVTINDVLVTSSDKSTWLISRDVYNAIRIQEWEVTGAKEIADRIKTLTNGALQVAPPVELPNDDNYAFRGEAGFYSPLETAKIPPLLQTIEEQVSVFPPEFWKNIGPRTLYTYATSYSSVTGEGATGGMSMWVNGGLEPKAAGAFFELTAAHEITHTAFNDFFGKFSLDGKSNPGKLSKTAQLAYAVYGDGWEKEYGGASSKEAFDSASAGDGWNLTEYRPNGFVHAYGHKGGVGEDAATVAECLFANHSACMEGAQGDTTLLAKILFVKETFSEISGGKMDDAYWENLNPLDPNYKLQPRLPDGKGGFVTDIGKYLKENPSTILSAVEQITAAPVEFPPDGIPVPEPPVTPSLFDPIPAPAPEPAGFLKDALSSLTEKAMSALEDAGLLPTDFKKVPQDELLYEFNNNPDRVISTLDQPPYLSAGGQLQNAPLNSKTIKRFIDDMMQQDEKYKAFEQANENALVQGEYGTFYITPDKVDNLLNTTGLTKLPSNVKVWFTQDEAEKFLRDYDSGISKPSWFNPLNVSTIVIEGVTDPATLHRIYPDKYDENGNRILSDGPGIKNTAITGGNIIGGIAGGSVIAGVLSGGPDSDAALAIDGATTTQNTSDAIGSLQRLVPTPTEAAMRVPVQLGETAYDYAADVAADVKRTFNIDTAPASKVLPSGTPSDASASCSPLFNTPCTSAAVNSCGQRGRGVYDCAGNCLALPPSDSSCVTPASSCQNPAATNFRGPLPCEFPAITVTGHLRANPILLHIGESAKISWSVSNASSCTVTGTNGDGVGANSTGRWNTLSSRPADKISSPIQGQTTYTLLCASLPGATPASFSESETVNIIPSYRE